MLNERSNSQYVLECVCTLRAILAFIYLLPQLFVQLMERYVFCNFCIFPVSLIQKVAYW